MIVNFYLALTVELDIIVIRLVSLVLMEKWHGYIKLWWDNIYLGNQIKFWLCLNPIRAGGRWISTHFFQTSISPWKKWSGAPCTQAPSRSPIRANFGEVGEGLMGIELSTLIVLLTNHRPFLWQLAWLLFRWLSGEGEDKARYFFYFLSWDVMYILICPWLKVFEL